MRSPYDLGALAQAGVSDPATARTSDELPSQLDVDAALDALRGPILYRTLTGARIRRTFIDKLIADALERPRT